MSFASLLINICTVQRFTAGAQDAYGNPAETWNPIHTDIACRWSTPKNREVRVGAEVVLADLLVFVNDIDVTEQDRVVLGGLTYQILSVVPRQNGTGGHHRELYVQVVK